ncbi:MAG: pantetheine-phosphate adenylyltransferase [Candidatus Marinamargulisbacteria bacterium]
MSVKAIYAGSFDPITNGHLDIIHRALNVFDTVYVSVIENVDKTALFSMEKRMDLIRNSIESDRIIVEGFHGLLVDYARKKNVFNLIRGLRAVSDFEYEFQMSLTNRSQESRIDTIFLMTDQSYSYLSSSIVRQLAKLGGNIKDYVTPYVAHELRKAYNGKS